VDEQFRSSRLVGLRQLHSSGAVLFIFVTTYHQKIPKGLYVYSNVGDLFFPNPEGILCVL
jgi:hypothetical protein